MNVNVYNTCMLASWAGISTGAWLQWGPGVGAMVAGGTFAGFTLLAAFLCGGLYGHGPREDR